MSEQINYVVSEAALYEVYELLSEATTAASTGDPNECASKAADAKERLKEVHKAGELLHEIEGNSADPDPATDGPTEGQR